VQACLLHEHVGLPPSHPQSYAHVIRTEFTDHVDIDSARMHGPDGNADDIFAAAAQYDASIAEAGPVDVQLLGIGANGHIGFNEPGSSLGSRTRVATLTEQTRQDNARFFESVDEVAVEGPVTSSCPASVLQLHPHVTVVVDEAAATQLENAEFYRYALKYQRAQQKYCVELREQAMSVD
jgi:glucosamine-6-phosphate deaminase